MNYTQRVLEHPLFIKIQKEISKLEDGRIYCHHELAHALDVCRIAWILYLEVYTIGEGENGLSGKAEATTTSGCRSESASPRSPKSFRQGESAVPSGESMATGKPERLDQMRDRIYVAGLLHDIGRAAQYTTGVHHSIAGIPLAEEILNDIGCPEDWKQETLEIVSEHWGREEKGLEPDSTAYYIDRADHLSRNCFACAASDTCKWKEEEKNRRLYC